MPIGDEHHSAEPLRLYVLQSSKRRSSGARPSSARAAVQEGDMRSVQHVAIVRRKAKFPDRARDLHPARATRRVPVCEERLGAHRGDERGLVPVVLHHKMRIAPDVVFAHVICRFQSRSGAHDSSRA